MTPKGWGGIRERSMLQAQKVLKTKVKLPSKRHICTAVSFLMPEWTKCRAISEKDKWPLRSFACFGCCVWFYRAFSCNFCAHSVNNRKKKYIHTIKKVDSKCHNVQHWKALWRDSCLNRRPGHFHQVIQGNSKASQHTREIKYLQRCPRSASGSTPRCTWMEHLSRKALGSRADQKSGSPQHGGPTALLWSSLLEM